MLKSLGILIGGIFIGAIGVEVIRKKCPDGIDAVYAKTREMASEAKEAFLNGYKNAVRPRTTAETTA